MKTITLFFGLLLVSICNFAQNIWTVDNRPGTTAQFSSLQAAIDAAAEGDFIYIHPSPTSYDNVTINKEIHLRGIGHHPELANGEFAAVNAIMLFTNNTGITASGSSISGLAINFFNDNNFGNISNVLIQNNRIASLTLSRPFNFIIQGNFFSSTQANFIRFATNVAHANNIISHNIFIRNANSQIDAVVEGLVSSETFNNNIVIFNNTPATNDLGLFENCTNPVVNNNIFLITSNNTIATELKLLNSSINFQNCLTFAFGGQTLNTLNGTGNLNNTNPQFVNIGDTANMAFTVSNNYKLNTGSPAIGAGSDGDDLGIFGQGFLFQMRGYPFDLPYPTSINITNAVVEAGGTLEVNFQAEANVED
ncbi:MAG TPA: hypothetical protein VKZ97_04080 [Flavobacteriaceae bacterium]|nr:hypothetical protein [Flavobacteriaceae bacterium]